MELSLTEQLERSAVNNHEYVWSCRTQSEPGNMVFHWHNRLSWCLFISLYKMNLNAKHHRHCCFCGQKVCLSIINVKRCSDVRAGCKKASSLPGQCYSPRRWQTSTSQPSPGGGWLSGWMDHFLTRHTYQHKQLGGWPSVLLLIIQITAITFHPGALPVKWNGSKPHWRPGKCFQAMDEAGMYWLVPW